MNARPYSREEIIAIEAALLADGYYPALEAAHRRWLASLRAQRDGAGAWRPGHRPEGNRAHVEVVSASDLLPGDVVWGEDGWHAILDWDQADSTQVCAALIIDDAGGRDESTILYGEWFLRIVPLAPVRGGGSSP